MKYGFADNDWLHKIVFGPIMFYDIEFYKLTKSKINGFFV